MLRGYSVPFTHASAAHFVGQLVPSYCTQDKFTTPLVFSFLLLFRAQHSALYNNTGTDKPLFISQKKIYNFYTNKR